MICTGCSYYRKRIKRGSRWYIECRNVPLGILTEVPEDLMEFCSSCSRMKPFQPRPVVTGDYTEAPTLKERIHREIKAKQREKEEL